MANRRGTARSIDRAIFQKTARKSKSVNYYNFRGGTRL